MKRLRDKFLEILKWFVNVKKRHVLIMLGSAVGVMVVALSVAGILYAITDSGPGYDEVFVETPILPEVIDFPPPEYEEEPEDEPEEICDEPLSRLTGLPIYEEYLNRRPIAVVINNIRRALPQSGIASADIIYEVLAEGDITRIVGIFQSCIPDMIGPVRSARDYFVDFAFNHDAIFVHHGASATGYGRIRGLSATALDGMALEGRVFWRDRTYPYWSFNTGTRPLEHSSYTGWYRMAGHLEYRGYRNYMSGGTEYGFIFGEIPEGIASLGEANQVIVPFSQNYTRTFIFCPETGAYLVENRDGPHLDAATREQISVSNILIKFTPMRVVDAEGRRNVTTVGDGHGYLAMGGEFFPVLWEKASHTSPTRWFFEDGAPIVLTPGRSWICVFQSGGAVEFY